MNRDDLEALREGWDFEVAICRARRTPQEDCLDEP